MKKRIIPMICLMLVSTFFAVTSLNNIYAVGETKDITFEDENMYNVLKGALSDKISSSNDATKTLTMTQDNIDSVQNLTLYDKNITNIKGIEEFTNLTKLRLQYNQISDINVLSKLINLTLLDLTDNNISDISALSGLTNLTELRISANNINDISALSELTNLTALYLGTTSLKFNISISDISALSKLTNLTELSLTNTNISDISVLNKLTKLTDLALGWNEISDISALKGLTNLKDLILESNNISDISALSELTKLTHLDLGINKIDDINSLSGLTNLTELRLYYNQINDVSPLSKLTNLTHLYLESNKIVDISPLSELTNLTHLSLALNHITDASLLYSNLKDVNGMSMYQGLSILSKQSIDVNTDINTVTLPKIFLQAKDENSRLYTAEDYILENCTLSADGRSVVIDEDAGYAKVRISGGEANSTILNISLLKLEVGKTTEELTNQNVVVTITANKTLNQLEGWTLSDDKMSLTKEYERNITESIKVTAEDGTTSTADISITNIDKDAPVIEYETKENEDGTLDIILKANEEVREVEGWKLSDDQMALTKTYTEPTTEEIKIYDLAGNEAYGTIEIKFKDNKLEVEEVKAEESKDNPKTGDMGLYLGLAMLTACVVLVASKKYKNKVEKK